jgi:hypothetical protein
MLREAFDGTGRSVLEAAAAPLALGSKLCMGCS